ncbi:hypothetical protein NKY44_29835 [Sinorhizobium meliloti]|uniref:hypothetical protein n=1 Tax=Rhizobium meliloti TaxID=382 RepID=UPI003D64BBEE
MHLVVCIKQVPDPAQIGIDPVTNTIMHQGVPTAINPHASKLSGASAERPEHWPPKYRASVSCHRSRLLLEVINS